MKRSISKIVKNIGNNISEKTKTEKEQKELIEELVTGVNQILEGKTKPFK